MRLSNKRPLGVDEFDAFRQGEASGRQPSTLSSHPDECSKPAIEPGGKCKAKASSGLEVPVKKQQRRKRLVVRTAGDMPLAGQHGQERLNVGGAHIPWVAHGATSPCRPAHEKAHPVNVGFFGAEAIVAVTQALPKLIQQAWGMQDRSGGFHGIFIPVFMHSV